MRVPKGTVSHNDQLEGEDDDWERLIQVAKARLIDEEREWQEALARAKQVRELDEEAEWRRLREQAAARARLEEEREWRDRARVAHLRTSRPAPVRHAQVQRVVAWP